MAQLTTEQYKQILRAQAAAKAGQAVAIQTKTPDVVRANVGNGSAGMVRPGDKLVDVNVSSVVPSDLIIIMDNTDGDAKKVFYIGGALPGHLRAFDNPNNLVVSGDWTNPDNFLANNDDLLEYYRLNMGLTMKGVDRQVNVSVDQFNEPVIAIRGTYNQQKQVSITTQINRFSSMDYDRKINNVVLNDSTLDFTFYNTYFFTVGVGEKLTMTFRVKQGLNWPLEG